MSVAVRGQLAEVRGPVGPASPPGNPGSGVNNGLRHSTGPWTRAAGGADALHTTLAAVRAEFEAAHGGLASGVRELGALAELSAVRGSWEARIDAARVECGSLAEKLRAVARIEGETDAAAGSSLTRIATAGAGDGGGAGGAGGGGG
ncbi:hypothetical protein ACPXCE_25740 [Streptomyces sp. DT24]|uniref:hypothetical protein n=1 Tax=unclassified Streptomyces TaxID=2593676 RepID=UPI0023B90BEF|nr:hypothetical protein [Streptomyces sp. AM 4-1-1]WEH34306.1 hypothetical protein PZB75_13615 [Streptomyces sp. AM 4-1-1]